MIALPNINQSVGVYVVEWEIELRSRIEETGSSSLTIAMPSDGRSERPLPRGAVVYVDWICDRGVVRVRGVVSELVRIPIPALLVVIDGEPEIHQRRNYVRVSANLPVVATPIVESDDDVEVLSVQGTTFDMSGGGMRVRLPRSDTQVGDRLRFAIAMPDNTMIEAVGRITRRPLPDVYCVQFEEIETNVRERVVRLVFERLRTVAGRAA